MAVNRCGFSAIDARLLMSECSKGWLIDKGELFKHKVMSEVLFRRLSLSKSEADGS